TYYTTTVTDHGKAGDLELVTITTPLSNGYSQVLNHYYRYYTDTGKDHLLRVDLGPEGYRQFVAYATAHSASTDPDNGGYDDSDLKPYADAVMDYDADRRLTSIYMNNGCGCGGAAGTIYFTRVLNPHWSDTS